MSLKKRKLSLKPTTQPTSSSAAERWISERQLLDTETQNPLKTELQNNGSTEAKNTLAPELQTSRGAETQKHGNTKINQSVHTEPQNQIDTEAQKTCKWKRITLDVSPELHQKLRRHAFETGEPMAELLRRLAEDYFS